MKLIKTKEKRKFKLKGFDVIAASFSLFAFLAFNLFQDVINFYVSGTSFNLEIIIIKISFPFITYFLALIILFLARGFARVFFVTTTTFLQALFLQLFFTQLDIVYTSWSVVLACLVGAILFFENFNIYNKEIIALKKMYSHSNQEAFGKYLYEELRFVFDKIIQALFLVATLLGVEETILWTLLGGDNYPYDKVLSISIYLVIGFVLTILGLFAFLILPAMRRIRHLKFHIFGLEEEFSNKR